jgi:hypothetical protein
MEAMSDFSSSPTDSLNALAEEFVTRYRRGERPALSEYTARHPELAERIEGLFPTLILMEKCGTPSDEASASRTVLPRQWGEYRLLREVGRGGMGIVYEAAQEALGRRVAIKVLPPALQHGKQRERFRREARAAARLHHTNIVPLFGVGEHEETLFLVMQLIDGAASTWSSATPARGAVAPRRLPKRPPSPGTNASWTFRAQRQPPSSDPMPRRPHLLKTPRPVPHRWVNRRRRPSSETWRG